VKKSSTDIAARHPVLMNFKTGVKKDGSITAMALQTLIDGGALRLLRRGQHVFYPVRCKPLRTIAPLPFPRLPTFTNKPPAYQSADTGTVQPRFGQKCSSIKCRKMQSILPIAPTHRGNRQCGTANFFRLSTVNLLECIRRVVKIFRLGGKSSANFRKAAALPRLLRPIHGRGGLPIYWNKIRTPACN